ncbi:MAG: hypothetical protein GXO30_00285 [Epsilonproteobacteria bacterium]|nr:hypothetical protein [Campylobacterota bacterium]
MQKIVLAAFLLATSFSFCFAQDLKIRTQEFPKKEMIKQKNEVAKLMAKGLSKNLPQKVDRYTTLMDVKNQGSTLIYTFEINTGVKKDETIIKQDHSRMQRAVTTGVCQSSSKLLEAGINTSYIYISAKSKKTLFRFDITQSRCIGLK